MSIDLMQKRFKVIADYPLNRHKVGEIIIPDHAPNSAFSCDGMNMYPNIFRPLAWWEDREEKDMPLYLKYTNWKNEKQWDIVKVGDDWQYDGCGYLKHIVKGKWSGGILMSGLQPATLSEYQSFINSKQLKS